MTMRLETLVHTAQERGASDVHLEGGMPMVLRVRGDLRTVGEPVSPGALTALARSIVGEDEWSAFVERGSHDASRSVGGARVRINILRTARGVGFAIRLLSSFQATLHTQNLHPDLKRLVVPHHGLVIITGSTGSGKTSTLAALLQELNLSEARHIITIEQPIEYALQPRLSFIRQREVGRDTPSFEQALVDAMREDPDVLMVGELREPHVMRLTLAAAETGHLVLATMHSSTAAEALQRIVSSFPAEIQGAVSAQLADCLVGVVAQRLSFRADPGIRVPECEVLMASTGVRALIRQGHFFKLASAIETGASDGSWSFARYGEWLSRKGDWHVPPPPPRELATRETAEPNDEAPEPALPPVALPRVAAKPAAPRPAPPKAATPPPKTRVNEEGVLELGEEDDPEAILRELELKGPS